MGGSDTDPASHSLFVDLYELTMAQAYVDGSMSERAVFSLYVRDLPPERSFLVAAGLEDALAYLEALRFSQEDVGYLASLGRFSKTFLDWLRGFEFTGDVYGMAEGTPVFPDEPLLEIEAPIAEAQIVETYLLNQLTFQTLIASKGARVVLAAGDLPVVDFGTRRSHGTDAALKAARALYLAGFASTSNVEAGRRYGIPVTGTMAHSYIQAHGDELNAFRSFVRHFPETVLLVDTYDTLEGVRHVIELARELGGAFRVRAIRLDSGDLDALSRQARGALDNAGLESVGIVASGGLDEHRIKRLRSTGAPISRYAVGTRVNVSTDAPVIETAYKLVAYGGEGRRKLSTGKATVPHRKQVFRRFEHGRAAGDTIARHDEALPGEPLLRPLMRGGRRVGAREDLDVARTRAHAELGRLPQRLLALGVSTEPYRVDLSDALTREIEGDAENR